MIRFGSDLLAGAVFFYSLEKLVVECHDDATFQGGISGAVSTALISNLKDNGQVSQFAP